MTLYNKFIQRPAYAVMTMILLTAAGFWSLSRMPIDYFPGLNYPLINVITQYPGVSPEDIEMLITRPIENELQTIRGIRRTSSISSSGISQVTVEFSQGYNLLEARQLVSAAISRLSGQLPDRVNPLIDNLGSRMQQIVGYTITNPNMPQTKLRQLIEYRFVPALRNVSGISRIEVFGGLRQAFVVEPDLNELNRLNLSMTDIFIILRDNNINVSGHYLEKYHLDIPIRGVGQVQTLDDLRSLWIKTGVNDLPIFLKDVARISSGYLPEHYIVQSNNRPAVAINIQKQDGYSTLKVAKEVDQEIKQLKSLLPPGSEIRKFYDQSEILDESMTGVKNEIWMGAILAILVLFFFLRRLSPTVIVALTIPLALFTALTLMDFSGYSLNMMTLAALTLSIGLVVDDSIIVMENIERHLESRTPSMQAVITGTRQILGADVSGTLTTMIVFVPLVFLTGFLGQLIVPFGLTIGYTLLASLIISLTVIPVLMKWKGGLDRNRKEPPHFVSAFIRWNDRRFYMAVKHKIRTFVCLACVFLILASATLLFNSARLMPVLDEGSILIEYIMRPGVSLNESSLMAKKLVDEIRKLPDVDNVYLKIGSPENTYYIEEVNKGELLAKLKDKHQRQKNADEIMAVLRNKFSTVSGVVFLFHHPTQEKIDESFSGLPAFFGVTITGDNLDSLVSLSKKVEAVAENTKGLSNVVNNAKYIVPLIEVLPIRPRLAYYSLSVEELMNQMSMAFRGKIVSQFIKEQTPVAIFLRLPEKQRKNIEDLRSLPIKTGNGQTLPLEQLATVQYRSVLPSITHLNSQREVTLIAEIEGNIWNIIYRLKSKLEELHFPDGYIYQIRGQYQILLQSLKQFGLVIFLAVVLVYLILYLQFNSFWQPFVILLKIPLDFIGVFIALLITRQSLNISVAIGILTVVGVSVNNAIVLVDMTNKLRKTEGLLHRDALLKAVHNRTRPIMMTGFTTIFALLPAAIGMGIGSKIHQPFAITLIGGMITGIFFSLNVIPALYEAFGRFERKK